MAEHDSTKATVFSTPELLEAILLELPMKRLLLCQRVNKQFKATIAQSPVLQQKLFFQQAPVDGRRFGSGGFNPLFHNKGWRLSRKPWESATFRFETEEDYNCYRKCGYKDSVDGDEDSSDSEEESSDSDGDDSASGGGGTKCNHLEINCYLKDCSNAASSDPNASWRKMYLVHPPYKLSGGWIHVEEEIDMGQEDLNLRYTNKTLGSMLEQALIDALDLFFEFQQMPVHEYSFMEDCECMECLEERDSEA